MCTSRMMTKMIMICEVIGLDMAGRNHWNRNSKQSKIVEFLFGVFCITVLVVGLEVLYGFAHTIQLYDNLITIRLSYNHNQ